MRKGVLAVLTAAVLLTIQLNLNKPESVSAADNSDDFMLIGHRGALGEAPQQSMQGFDYAVQHGAQAIEFDIQVTADHQLVVSHDETTGPIFDEKLHIKQNSLSRLRQLTYKEVPYEHLHTVEEVFAHFAQNPNLKYLVEFKDTVGGQEQTLLNLINKYNLGGRVYVESFFQGPLDEMRAISPSTPTIILIGQQANLVKGLNASRDPYVGIADYMGTARNFALISSYHKKIMVWDVSRNSNTQPSAYTAAMPISGGIVNFLSQANAELNGVTNVNPTDRYQNQQVVRVTHPGEIDLYSEPSANAAVTQTIQGNSNWKVKNMKLVNGVIWYDLGQNMWLNGDYTNITNTQAAKATPRVITVNYVPRYYVYLRNGQGKMQKQRVRHGSKWKVVGQKIIAGKLYYRLGSDKQWIAEEYTL